MSEIDRHAFLSHPTLGALPAHRVLECVFALTADGAILHHHLEELRVLPAAEGVVYTFNGRPAAPGRERCRVIPPLARAFER